MAMHIGVFWDMMLCNLGTKQTNTFKKSAATIFIEESSAYTCRLGIILNGLV